MAWPGLGLDAATVWMVVGENGAAETKVAADDDDDDTGGRTQTRLDFLSFYL